jgi:hypothetical protein
MFMLNVINGIFYSTRKEKHKKLPLRLLYFSVSTNLIADEELYS